MTTAMFTLLILFVIIANAPFLTQRVLGIWTVHHKHFGMYALEWLLGLLLLGGIAYILENRSGMVHRQDWQFYVVVLCLYLVAAFPAFVWRYFWHGRDKE